MHNSVSRKSSLLYIFKPNVSQCQFTLPRSLPSLSFYTFPLHSPSLSAIMLPHSPTPSISLPHPFRSVAVAGTMVFAVPFSNPHRTCRRWLQVCCFAVLLFCAAFILWEMDDYQRGFSHYQNLQFFPFVLWVWHRFRFCVGKKRW